MGRHHSVSDSHIARNTLLVVGGVALAGALGAPQALASNAVSEAAHVHTPGVDHGHEVSAAAHARNAAKVHDEDADEVGDDDAGDGDVVDDGGVDGGDVVPPISDVPFTP